MSTEDWQPNYEKSKPVPYEVGKYHPPKHTRFQKGQSGNPKGRPKKPVHIGVTIDNLLNRQIPVVVDGKKTKLPGVEALLRKAFGEALKGDYRMLKLFLEFAKQRPDSKEEPDDGPTDEQLNSKVNKLLARLREEKAEQEEWGGASCLKAPLP
jgi:hypothetical protein